MKRLSIPIDDELFEILKTVIPDRVRSETYRRLMAMMIKCQKSHMNTYVVDDILNDRLVLARLDQLRPEVREVYDAQVA